MRLAPTPNPFLLSRPNDRCPRCGSHSRGNCEGANSMRVYLSLAAGLLAAPLFLLPAAALASGTLTVEAQPSLGSIATAGQPAPTYAVATGDSVQLTAKLVAPDGTVTDVTTDVETQFMAYVPGVVSVDGAGVVTVRSVPGGGPAPIIAIFHGSQMASINFAVSP